MSRGHGRVEQAILAVFAADPDNAFLADELVERVYGGVNRIKKKHRVAVLRAGKNLATPASGISWMRGGGLGGRIAFFSKYNVRSYAMARLKTMHQYRPNDSRIAWSYTEAQLRETIAEGGREHRYVIEGGAWWRHVQQWTAERDGDDETVAKMRAENEKLLAALGVGIVAAPGKR